MAAETNTTVNNALSVRTEPMRQEVSRTEVEARQRPVGPEVTAAAGDVQGTRETPVRSADSEAGSLKEAVEKANERAETLDRKVRFKLDQESGEVVVRVVNADTDEVIRQIPPQELLELSQKLEGSMEGLLIEITA